MTRPLPLLATACLLLAVAPLTSSEGPPAEVVDERFYDGEGRLVRERGHLADEDGIAFDRHTTYVASREPARAGGGKPGGGEDPGTDCESDAFKRTGYKWSAPYSGYVDAHASEFITSAETWDAATGADIFGAFELGVAGVAGVRDDVNQLQFVSLGASTTIAVTTTWYNTFTGIAVESDGRYNTYYAWATDGSASAMDVQNIATHEIGHTFGLSHPTNKPQNGCLTMYAYGSEGETQKRTLGDGDILGLKAVYSG